MSHFDDDYDGYKAARAERRAEHEPSRIQHATDQIMDAGFVVSWNDSEKMLSVWSPKNHRILICRFWPYTGWYSGKGIGSGRGIHNLLKKLGGEI